MGLLTLGFQLKTGPAASGWAEEPAKEQRVVRWQPSKQTDFIFTPTHSHKQVEFASCLKSNTHEIFPEKS